MSNHKKQDYANLGAFFRALPEENPKLAPLLLYVNRPTISQFFKGNKNISFMVPSHNMMSELKKDFESKDYKSLDLKILSLIIPNTLKSTSDWRNVNTTIGNTEIPIKSITHKNIIFENNTKAELSKTFNCSNGNICFWELEGNHIPCGKIQKKKKMETVQTQKPVKGKFENPQSTLESKEKELILKDLKKGNFKQLVCDLYASLDAENKELANCLINGNPAAEFFLLFDSPIIKYDSNAYIENTVTNTTDFYNEILAQKSEYLCNSGDHQKINELKEFLGDSHFYENEYKRFYTEVENNGEFNMNDEVLKICPPVIGKYLYSIEIFCTYIKILHDKLETATPEDHPSIINDMIIFNLTTNQKSTKNIIFEDSDNPVENLDIFKMRFEKAGLCLFKTTTVTGSGQKKIKVKSRKLTKHKNMFKTMDAHQKEKLKKYLNAN